VLGELTRTRGEAWETYDGGTSEDLTACRGVMHRDQQSLGHPMTGVERWSGGGGGGAVSAVRRVRPWSAEAAPADSADPHPPTAAMQVMHARTARTPPGTSSSSSNPYRDQSMLRSARQLSALAQRRGVDGRCALTRSLGRWDG
jgi:hypothetical protein